MIRGIGLLVGVVAFSASHEASATILFKIVRGQHLLEGREMAPAEHITVGHYARYAHNRCSGMNCDDIGNGERRAEQPVSFSSFSSPDDRDGNAVGVRLAKPDLRFVHGFVILRPKYLSVVADLISGSLTRILDDIVDPGSSPVLDARDSKIGGHDVGPELTLGCSARDLVARSRLIKGLVSLSHISKKEDDARKRDGGLAERDYQNPPSPIRGLPLSIKVPLSALLLMKRAYGIINAVGSPSLRLSTAVGYTLLSSAAIVRRLLLCFASVLSR